MPILTHTLSLTGLAERQEPHVITQTIVQDFTTYTTLITLGTIPTDDAGSDGRHNNVEPSGDSGGISSGELGAILGGVAAFVLISIIVCLCCTRSRRNVRVYDYSSYATSSIAVDVHTTRVRRPPPVAERIPGGPKFPTYRAIPIPNPRNPTVRYTTR